MIRCKSRPAISLGFVVALFVAWPCRADLIVYDGFDYADGNLNGENGGEGEWTGNWNSGAFQAMSVASGVSLSYQSGATTLPTTGGHLLDTDGGGERMTLIVESEPRCDPGVAARIRRDLHDALALSPDVTLCAPGTIERPQGKAVRVVDRRPRR